MKFAVAIALVLTCTVQCFAGGEATTGSNQKSLRILSYNIKFLPRIIRRSHHYPLKRAPLIPAYIMEENPDIVVFQEAFDGAADRILKKKLKAQYPYMLGPLNKKPGFKINGGVLICSKYPLKQLGAVQYSQCEDFDCWARKGVMLVEVSDGTHTFQIAGTHMNGGGSVELKTSQYREMGNLVKQFARPGVPQFCVGDYNTSNLEPQYYNALITNLDAQDGPISGNLTVTNDHLNNDMEEDFNPKDRNIIDYILYRPNGVKPQKMTRTIKQYCYQWNKDHCDLSDHYALLMELTW
jgi:endonuclease/exonuclease/phosphatase family metal-dependent hydrolase